MTRYKKTYINPKTGKDLSKMTSMRYDTTNISTWQKRAEDSLRDGDKMTVVTEPGFGGKLRVSKVITDHADGTRSIVEFFKSKSSSKKTKTNKK